MDNMTAHTDRDATLNLVANLLANENLNVIRSNVSTAFFDLKTRTLILPQWKEITPEVDQMLVAHEVSHALFTGNEFFEAFETILNFKGAKQYLNILEDARVEKLMKRKYPGIRKTFNAGYNYLNDLDFFGAKSKDLSSLCLMDRINLYFKVGYNCGVTFTPQEKPFVVRAERTETIKDVIQLASDIASFVKEQKVSKVEIPDEVDEDDDLEGDFGDEADDDDSNLDSNNKDDGGDEEDTEDVDSDNEEGDDSRPDEGNDEEEEKTPQKNSPETPETEDGFDEEESKEEEKELPSPTTDKAFDEQVKALANDKLVYKYWSVSKMKCNPILEYKDVFAKVDFRFLSKPIGEYRMAEIKTFKHDTQNNVDYLVKEFEMKKAATEYKRITVAKSGSLDMKKVWSYKINEDLFKRISTTHKGKNHGMIFLLDWSGSMRRTIQDTLDQVINLATFCQRINIPFQVFAFVSDTITESAMKYLEANRRREYNDPDYRNKSEIDVSIQRFTLLELMSSKMTKTEFSKMVDIMKSGRLQDTFHMYSTPLNESLIFMYDYIEKFQKINNVEKLSFITLNDGQGHALPINCDYQTLVNKQYIKIRHFMKDAFSKKNIEFSADGASQSRTLLQLIKNRYGCSIVGFFVVQGNQSRLTEGIRGYYDSAVGGMIPQMIDKIKSEYRENGCATLTGTGHDELFLIPPTRVYTAPLEVKSNATAKSIAKQFTKYLSKKKTSRVLLNKFIGHVA